MHFHKRLCRALAVLLCLTLPPVAMKAADAKPAAPPKHEVRAVWLTTIGGIDWPHSYATSEASAIRQKEELIGILDRLHEANINTVLLQTRIRATTIYPSLLEPWDGCMSGMPGRAPAYDPLAFAIEECHKRGMELHAWVVAIPVGPWNGLGCKTLRQSHPRMVKRIGDKGFINPESPEAAPYIASICQEITRSYDIDGIHLDYIRYPEEWPTPKKRGIIDLGEKARQNITTIVREVYSSVKNIKPWVKVSCSPVGKFDDLSRFSSRGWNAFRRVGQDAQGWLRDGVMDMLFPMMYFRGNQFFPFALDWQAQSQGRPICAGLGIYFLSPKEGNWTLTDVRRQLYFLRDEGIGHAYFRSKFLTDDTKGIYRLASRIFDTYPALVPPITWQGTQVPAEPEDFQVERHAKGDVLSWQQGSDTVAYNLYASTSWPVDTSDPRNLVAVRLRECSLTMERDSSLPPLHYALTAINRYGLESPAALSPSPAAPEPAEGSFIITLPPIQGLNAKYISFETIQGTPIFTVAYAAGQPIDLSRLPAGLYQIRTHAKKGAPHRLGFVLVKREPYLPGATLMML